MNKLRYIFILAHSVLASIVGHAQNYDQVNPTVDSLYLRGFLADVHNKNLKPEYIYTKYFRIKDTVIMHNLNRHDTMVSYYKEKKIPAIKSDLKRYYKTY